MYAMLTHIFVLCNFLRFGADENVCENIRQSRVFLIKKGRLRDLPFDAGAHNCQNSRQAKQVIFSPLEHPPLRIHEYRFVWVGIFMFWDGVWVSLHNCMHCRIKMDRSQSNKTHTICFWFASNFFIIWDVVINVSVNYICVDLLEDPLSSCPVSVNTKNREERPAHMSPGDLSTSLLHKCLQLPMSRPRLAAPALSQTSSSPRCQRQPHKRNPHTTTTPTKPDKWFRFVLYSPGKKLSIQSAKWCQGFVSKAYEWQKQPTSFHSPPSPSQPKNTSTAGQEDWEPGNFIDFFPLHPHLLK